MSELSVQLFEANRMQLDRIAEHFVSHPIVTHNMLLEIDLGYYVFCLLPSYFVFVCKIIQLCSATDLELVRVLKINFSE